MFQPLKTILSSHHLDFALRHVTSYYDTDFFPRAEEFGAIEYYWDEVKEDLLSSDLDELLSATPLVEPWPKPRGGFRIVHRPEPIDSIIYTALARRVAPRIESSRASPRIACAYRISPTQNSFFTDGSGFDIYRKQCEELAQTHSCVLCTDIADFYNKIYLHRLQNAIQSATDDPPGISQTIEYFLSNLNTRASQGIPVGPAASIIMAEAVLIDVDQFIAARGFPHVRYVDDIRVFGNDFQKLRALLQELAVYIHESQRLGLSGEKTKILKSDEFLHGELNNQYQLEKLDILSEIEIVNPYTMEVEELDYVISEGAGERLLDALVRVRRFETVDLGVVRAIVRRAKAHNIKDVADFLIDNLEFFAPAVNDIALYLDAVSDEGFLTSRRVRLSAACEDAAMNIRAVRLWMEWYFSRHATLLAEQKVRAFIMSSPRLRTQANAAITIKDQSWAKDRKYQLLHHAHWDRRSIILAAQVLSKDEREKWLVPLIKKAKLDRTEAVLARWVLEGAPKTAKSYHDSPF